MEIRWKASFSASCLHAVLCHAQGLRAIDRDIEKRIAAPADQLLSAIRVCNLDTLPVLKDLVNFASEFENNRQLVEVVLARRVGTVDENTISQVVAAIGTIKTTMLSARPGIVDELALRGRPLQEQWHARGPGLLRYLAKLTAENFVSQAAEVVLVTPWVGGYGYAHPKTNRVIFEAVLADPHDDLPEALRLGWLLSQLQADVPLYSEAISAGRLPDVAALATVPAILAAAQELEWVNCDSATIGRALECWYPAAQGKGIRADTLYGWWRTYDQGNTAWKIAWRALEPLLG